MADKHQEAGSVLDIAAQVIKLPVQFTVSTAKKIDSRVVSFVLILAVVFATGWAGARATDSSRAQATTDPAPSLQEAGLVGGTPIGVTVPDVGVLDGVTITGTWIKAPPGSETQEYIVSVSFQRRFRLTAMTRAAKP
jgi:hypothetical protein